MGIGSGSIPFLQKHQAIRNRGYTSKVRLRGLILACGGRLCLCSRGSAVGGSPSVGDCRPDFQSEGNLQKWDAPIGSFTSCDRAFNYPYIKNIIHLANLLAHVNLFEKSICAYN